MDKIINKNIDKIKEKSVKNITNNYYSNVNDEVEDEKYMEYIYKEMNDDIVNLYEEEYKFDNDDSIIIYWLIVMIFDILLFIFYRCLM